MQHQRKCAHCSASPQQALNAAMDNGQVEAGWHSVGRLVAESGCGLSTIRGLDIGALQPRPLS
jgi:hypothetical protein